MEKDATQAPEGAWRIVGLNDEGKQPGQTLDGEDQAEKLNMLRLLQEAVEETGFTGIELVDLTDRLNLCFYYEDRFLVQLGSESNLANKLQLLQEVLANNVQEGEVGILDASINKRVSIIPYTQDQLAELMPYLQGPTPPQEETTTEETQDPSDQETPSENGSEESGASDGEEDPSSTPEQEEESSQGDSDSAQESTEGEENSDSQAG